MLFILNAFTLKNKLETKNIINILKMLLQLLKSTVQTGMSF